MTLLDTDLAAFQTTALAAAQPELVQLLADIVTALDVDDAAISALQTSEAAQDAELADLAAVAATAQATILASKTLERRVLDTGVVWNPQRLAELEAEGVT